MKTVHLFALLGLAAALGIPRAGAEGDRQDAAPANREEIRRDRQEIETFEEFMNVLDASSRKEQREDYLMLNLELHQAMTREVAQAETRAEWARRHHPAPRGYRRPAEDDERDLSTPRGRYVRLRELVEEAENLVPGLAKWDLTALARNREVLGEFLDVMRADLKASENARIAGDPGR